MSRRYFLLGHPQKDGTCELIERRRDPFYAPGSHSAYAYRPIPDRRWMVRGPNEARLLIQAQFGPGHWLKLAAAGWEYGIASRPTED